jgi:hypothetical protein
VKIVRVIVAGGRDFADAELLNSVLCEMYGDKDIEVVCGDASGADTLGKKWAEKNGKAVKSFPADWRKYGKKAGPIRNRQMAEYGTHLVAFWDGVSRGTGGMINVASELGLDVTVVHYE